MLLLVVRERLRRFAEIDLALHDAVRRALAAVVATVNEPAPIDEIALARRDGEERETRVGLPKLKERTEIVREVRLPQDAERGMTRFRFRDGVDRGHEAGRQLEVSFGPQPDVRHAQHGRPNLLRLELGQDALRGGEVAHTDRLRR